MKLYRYWTRVDVDSHGREVPPPGMTAAAGWSNQSEQRAREMAMERLAQWFRRDGDFPLDRYGYADRPMREPIVDEQWRDEKRISAITRNAYGAYVLNAAEVFFADIDHDRGENVFKQVWMRIRGQRPPAPEQQLMDRLTSLAHQRGLGLRVYRTRGGHRVMLTSGTMDPKAAESEELLAAFGSDPLYIRLCRMQECYRARLSPKPWRIGLRTPYILGRFPWRDHEAREVFEAWSRQYEQAAADWAVCEHVTSIGEARIHPHVQPVLTLHDQRTCAGRKPLA